MTSEELIRTIEASGGRIRVEGADLAISPRSIVAPLRAELIGHKQEIIELLSCRPPVPSGVRLITYAPLPPPVRILECSVVTSTEHFIAMTLEQLAAHLNGQTWQSGNWPLPELLDRLAKCGCVVELDHPGR